MKKSSYNTWKVSLAVLVISVVAIGVVFSPLWGLLNSPEHLRDVVREFGWLAPVVIIAIHALQVVIAPIPGTAIDLANGYLFGWWLGTIISLVGITIGSVVAIGLAKRFGRPLVERLITPKGVQQIRAYTLGKNQWLFFFLFLLPGTPDDALCFAIGLSSIPLGRAVVITLLGRTPGIMAAVITGATGQSLNILEFTVVSFAVSLLLWVIVWNTPLRKMMQIPKNPAASR